MYKTKNTSDWVNETRVVFDDSLKLAVLTLHEQNPDKCIDLLRTNIHEDVSMGQRIIRDWFVKNQFMFNINGRLTYAFGNMPDFYALLCLNICNNLEECQSWSDVVSQIHNSMSVKSPRDSLIFCDFALEETDTNCACSHSVCSENTFMIKHYSTNLHLMLGSDCGEKIGIISKGEFTKMKKPSVYETLQLNRKLKNKNNRDKKNFIFNKWNEFSQQILFFTKNFRKCMDCEVLNIQRQEPKWMVRCKPCYVQHFYPKKEEDDDIC
jgi:hypothetical protein